MSKNNKSFLPFQQPNSVKWLAPMWLVNSLHWQFLWTNSDALKNFKSLFLVECFGLNSDLWGVYFRLVFGQFVWNFVIMFEIYWTPKESSRYFYHFLISWDLASKLKTFFSQVLLWSWKNEALKYKSQTPYFGSMCADHNACLCFSDCLALLGWKICTESLTNPLIFFGLGKLRGGRGWVSAQSLFINSMLKLSLAVQYQYP